MGQIKKILLYLIGVGLLIFGNRDVLAKISNKKAETPEKEVKSDPKIFSKRKDSVRREAIKVVEKQNNALLDSTQAVATEKIAVEGEEQTLKKIEQKKKKKKAELVTAATSEEAQKAEEAPKTNVEKEEPEKAHGTQ